MELRVRRVLRHDPVDPVLSQLARTGVVEVRRITFKHRQSYKQQSITLVTMVTSTPLRKRGSNWIKNPQV